MPAKPEPPQHRSATKASAETGKLIDGQAEVASDRMWHLYVLQCTDGSLYCGIALNVQKRLAQHQKGKGARYTRARLPVVLLSSIAIGPDVAEALRAERRFKALPRTKKLKSLKSSFALLR